MIYRAPEEHRDNVSGVTNDREERKRSAGLHVTLHFVSTRLSARSAQRDEFVATRQTAFSASSPVMRWICAASSVR